MNIQLKMQLRNTLLAQVNGLMREYDIPASDVEDALIYIQNELKDIVLQDYMQEVLSPKEENERTEEIVEEEQRGER